MSTERKAEPLQEDLADRATPLLMKPKVLPEAETVISLLLSSVSVNDWEARGKGFTPKVRRVLDHEAFLIHFPAK